MTCDLCKEKHVYALRSLGKGIWACRKCCYSEPTSKIVGIEKVKLVNMTVSRRQLEELSRRRILPYKKPGGGYYLGRMGENGKIQEKWPNYAS